MNFPIFYLTWEELDAMLAERAARVRTQAAEPLAMARELISELPFRHHIDALRMIAIERKRQMVGVDDLPLEEQHAVGVAAVGQAMPALRWINQVGGEEPALEQLVTMEITDRATRLVVMLTCRNMMPCYVSAT